MNPPLYSKDQRVLTEGFGAAIVRDIFQTLNKTADEETRYAYEISPCDATHEKFLVLETDILAPADTSTL